MFKRSILSAALVALLAAPGYAQVAINEVDYQNPGTDDTEWIELVGRAGTDLTGWTLDLLNGGSPYGSFTLTGAIPNDFKSAWGGDAGFFVVGTYDAETSARVTAINTGVNADINAAYQGTGPGAVPANAAPDFTPAGWTSNEVQNGPADIIQLRDAGGNLIDEWEYDSGTANSATGLSQATDAFDSAGSDTGTGGDISSIGRLGYSFSTPILVFDGADAHDEIPGLPGAELNLFDREPNSTPSWTFDTFGAMNFTSQNFGVTFSANVGDSFTESTAQEIQWSGTDGFNNEPAGATPGTFNNVSFGEGSQDPFTINVAGVVPEPSSIAIMVLGGLGLIGLAVRRVRK